MFELIEGATARIVLALVLLVVFLVLVVPGSGEFCNPLNGCHPISMVQAYPALVLPAAALGVGSVVLFYLGMRRAKSP